MTETDTSNPTATPMVGDIVRRGAFARKIICMADRMVQYQSPSGCCSWSSHDSWVLWASEGILITETEFRRCIRTGHNLRKRN